MPKNYKFAVQILYFDCEQFILKTIENCSSFVEKIYVVYSPEPWSEYNKDARKLYKNPSSTDVLKKSPHYGKIELIQGVWQTEEEQRNECLKKAKKDGYDYLIIQDADEFYSPDNYKKNIEEIIKNPDFDFYRNPWYFFWKNINTIVVSLYSISNGTFTPYKETLLAYNACFAVNCNKNVWFKDKRLLETKNYFMLSGLCLHLSYVLSDDQLIRKLNTWGHSKQVNIDLWYQVKWLGWTKNTNYFHPFNSIQWVKTIAYDGPIPRELEGFKPGKQKYVKPSLNKKFNAFFYDIKNVIFFMMKDIVFLLKKIKKQ